MQQCTCKDKPSLSKLAPYFLCQTPSDTGILVNVFKTGHARLILACMVLSRSPAKINLCLTRDSLNVF